MSALLPFENFSLTNYPLSSLPEFKFLNTCCSTTIPGCDLFCQTNESSKVYQKGKHKIVLLILISFLI